METVLIDGYNLLYRDGALKNLAERSLEDARDQLLAALAAYRSVGMEMVVVFDGRGGESRRRSTAGPGLTIRFSRHPQTADELILKIIEQREKKASLTVVTSDKKDIGRIALAEGVRWVSSEAFLRRLQRSRKERGGPAEKPLRTPPEEMEYWLRRFGCGGEEEK